jgi:hypothetical protein
MDFKHARERLAQGEQHPRWKDLVETLESEYAQFLATVKEWQSLQMEKVQQGRQRLADRLDASYRELEKSLKMQRKRLALLTAQIYL